MRPGVAGIAVTHDRVLNWLVARALAADLRSGRRTVDDVVALLARLNTPDAIAPGLAYRLGYVRLDLLWLCARALPPETVLALVDRLLEGPEERINEGSFIEEDLAGLGPPILPTLALIAAQPDDEHRLRAVHAARAIATVGQQDAAGARAIIAALVVQTDHALTMGLAAAARLSVPAAIDRLWAIHHERRTAASVASDDLDIHARHDLFDRSQSSFKALKRAMMDQCVWIEAKLGVTDDMISAEILLELLLAIDHGSAREIWQRKKHIFLDRLPAGRTILARAIGRFGDGDEAVRLETESEGAEWLEPTRRFDALLQVAPERAVEQIDRLDADTLQHGWFSVRRLIREGGAEAKARLLARHERGWEAMRDLVMLYWHDVDLIDLPAFDAVVAALENRLAEVAGTEWSPRGEGHLINFLSQTRRPDLLARLTARRGGRLELLLRDLANDRGSRPSLCVDRDAEQIERLLLLIGGEGYGEMVAHAIRRETVFAREDGYEAALRLPPGSPHVEGLAAAAVAEDRHQRENYDLMLALAAQKLDGALYELIASTAAAYTDALDIRASLGPMDETVAGRIRTDLESLESAVRIGATLALAFAPPSDVADLLAQTLARCPDGDDSSLTVVRIAHHLNSYTPGMLPQLTRMLGHADSKVREAVLPYLAAGGDSKARAVASRRMANESSPVIDHCALKTAFSLSAHEQASGTGIERLNLFVDRHHGVYPVGLIAARLHERDAMSNAQIVELAYTARRLSAQSSAYLIGRVAQFDRDEAHGIAERHFAQTPSSSAARQLLTLGGEAAIDHMLQRYLDEEQHRIRWVIARAVRRHADRTLLLDRLAVWTRGNSADRRIAAAELLSWLPGQRSSALLDELARDPVPEVADAALDGIGRLRAEDHARTLIGELQAADHLGRWSRLYAIIELVDPYLLEQDPNGLELGAVIDPFGEAFVISAEGAIKKRKDAVQKQAEQLDREARD